MFPFLPDDFLFTQQLGFICLPQSGGLQRSEENSEPRRGDIIVATI